MTNMATHTALSELTDRVYEAHAQIQAKHQHMNPVVEMRGGMRTQGIPADVLTIDCLVTNRRIIFILHDEQTDAVFYQWTVRDQDSNQTNESANEQADKQNNDNSFKQIALSELTSALLFDWMQTYFEPK